MRHPDYPFWNFISLVVLLLPAPWHWKARNVATVCLIFWLWLHHLVGFINTLIWAESYADVAPVWCDISARFALLLPYAVPLCSLAQMRRLAAVASPTRTVALDQASKRYRSIEDLIICLVCPLIMIPVNYTVQGHRYDIQETHGPTIPAVITWPTIAIRFILPIIFASVSLFYASMAMRWFFIRRSQFRSILSGSGLTTGVYLRLLGLAISDSFLVMFGTLFNFLANLVHYGEKVQPVTSWASIHSNFSLISQFPEEAQESFYPIGTIALPHYIGVMYALTVFAFFSFGEDAVRQYLKAWRFGKRVCRIPLKKEPVAIPTLGSTIVTLAGPAWEETLTRPSDSADEGMLGNRPTSNGISVTVERSVV